MSEKTEQCTETISDLSSVPESAKRRKPPVPSDPPDRQEDEETQATIDWDWKKYRIRVRRSRQ